MRYSAFLAFLLLPAGLLTAQDDILLLKGESEGEPLILVGKVLELTEQTITFQDQKKGKMTLPLDSIEPHSLYRIRAQRIAEGDAQGHFTLGDWCLSKALFSAAIREFEQASSLDASRMEACQARIKTCREEDARTKLEEAKRLVLQKKYDAAVKILTYVMKTYADTPYGDRAREENEKVASALRAENEEKAKGLEKKKKDDEESKARARVAVERKILTEVSGLLEEARKSFAEGLDTEAKDNQTKCRKAWENAETKLDFARIRLESALKVEDAALQKEAADLSREVVAWLVKVCWRLARNYADQLTYADAIKYANKALGLPHDDSMERILNELLLTITQLRMKQRAGTGY